MQNVPSRYVKVSNGISFDVRLQAMQEVMVSGVMVQVSS
jgi:hypothetical protein